MIIFSEHIFNTRVTAQNILKAFDKAWHAKLLCNVNGAIFLPSSTTEPTEKVVLAVKVLL